MIDIYSGFPLRDQLVTATIQFIAIHSLTTTIVDQLHNTTITLKLQLQITRQLKLRIMTIQEYIRKLNHSFEVI